MPAQGDLFSLPASHPLHGIREGLPFQTYPRYQAVIMAEVCHQENTMVGTAVTVTWWILLLLQDTRLRTQSL